MKNIFWAVAFTLVAMAWFYGLGIDLTGDSGLYAAISRQMVESGNWLELNINGQPYDQKPHLFFWLAGLGIKLFGTTNVSYKLFLFLFGVSGIYFTYRLGRLLYSETAGRLAALFTGTSQMFFLYFFDIHTDTVLQSAVILSLWHFAAYLKHQKVFNFILAFAGTGLAMLTKGPVGAVLPFFFVLFYLLLEKDFRQLYQLKWLAGILLVLLIIAPTLYHLWKSFGVEGLRFYFIDNNIGRVSGEVAGSSTDPFFYIYNLLWAFLPWTIPVITGLILEVKAWFKGNNFYPTNAALLGSVVILFVIYSIARGKAPNYLMMLMPPMAVVAAGRIQSFKSWAPKQKAWFVSIHGIVLAFIGFLFFAAWHFVLGEKGTALPVLLLLAVAMLLLAFYRLERENTRRLIYTSLLIAGGFNVFLNVRVVPELFSYQGARQAIAWFEEKKSTHQQLYNWDMEEYELFFMAEDSVRNIATWDQMHKAMKKPETWLYTNQKKYDEIVKMGFEIDTVYRIEQRGMNSINFEFLNAETRRSSLEPHFLIKTEDGFN